jgi:hypothetical protein
MDEQRLEGGCGRRGWGVSELQPCLGSSQLLSCPCKAGPERTQQHKHANAWQMPDPFTFTSSCLSSHPGCLSKTSFSLFLEACPKSANPGYLLQLASPCQSRRPGQEEPGAGGREAGVQGLALALKSAVGHLAGSIPSLSLSFPLCRESIIRHIRIRAGK